MAIGAIVAKELYGIAVPVVVVEAARYRSLVTGAKISVHAGDDGASVVVG